MGLFIRADFEKKQTMYLLLLGRIIYFITREEMYTMNSMYFLLIPMLWFLKKNFTRLNNCCGLTVLQKRVPMLRFNRKDYCVVPTLPFNQRLNFSVYVPSVIVLHK
jgi:hypothetical protein